MAIPGRRSRSPVPGLAGVPLGYRTIAEQIAGRLRDAIAGGTIRPAARLLEAPLARQMGTSRAPVREAIALLEREGLVVKEPNRGARVVNVTAETVREVATLRGVLEGFAASLAVDRLRPEDLAALAKILDRMERAARRGEFSRVLALDYEFHAFICKASGHRMLYDTWSAMERKVRLFLSATNVLYRDLAAIVRGHAEILTALQRHDKRRAQRIMADHLAEMLDACAARSRETRGRR
jgi:DNA-binding GntR family transcriptional regulator